jgi:hypothetical protein
MVELYLHSAGMLDKAISAKSKGDVCVKSNLESFSIKIEELRRDDDK